MSHDIFNFCLGILCFFAAVFRGAVKNWVTLKWFYDTFGIFYGKNIYYCVINIYISPAMGKKKRHGLSIGFFMANGKCYNPH